MPFPLRPVMEFELDASGRIGRDAVCRGCGYNLRGLLPDGSCPECGIAVMDSRFGDQLLHCSPKWVDQVASGARWVLVALLIGVLSVVLMQEWVLLGAFVVLLVGLWRFTAPEPGRWHITGERQRRLALRGLTILAVPVGAVVVAMENLGADASLAIAVWGLLELIRMLALFVYAACLAKRVPDRGLAFQLRSVVWSPIVLVMAGLFLFMLDGLSTRAPGADELIASALGYLLLFCIVWALVAIVRLQRVLSRTADVAKQMGREGASSQ